MHRWESPKGRRVSGAKGQEGGTRTTTEETTYHDFAGSQKMTRAEGKHRAEKGNRTYKKKKKVSGFIKTSERNFTKREEKALYLSERKA